MKTMLALDRQKNVVFPLDLSAEVPRTIAGCCLTLQIMCSVAQSGIY